jgi:hypothetical protein
MSHAASALPTLREVVIVARVDEVTERGPVVSAPELGRQLARVAVFGDYRPRRGDTVLVCTDAHASPYVLGVLSHLREAPTHEPVRFETAEDGATVLRVAEGDLRIEAPRVTITAREGLDVESERHVRVRARGEVELGSIGDDGAARSSLRMDGDAAELRAGLLVTSAMKLHQLADEATVLASRLEVRVDHLRQRAEELETDATRIVETAKETYRTVEDLAQVQAGRLRLVAKTTFHALAERAKLKAKGIFAVDGERIYLG